VVAALMLMGGLLYLLPFVSRGWIPHDEGMIGQAAERVLAGGLPHVDYQESYTGGLTWLYAALFALTDVDLVNVRWLLFAAASVSIWFVYSILRRYLTPIAAAIAALVALAWSFPNYFAGLPSWWVLLCALLCLWTVIRHTETGLLRYVVVAGLAAGIGIVIKQTGVYLFIALCMSLMFGTDERKQTSALPRYFNPLFRLGLSACALLFAVFVMRSRLHAAEVIYLLLPIAVVSLTLVWSDDSRAGLFGGSLAGIAVAGLCAAVPLAILLTPYIVQGNVSQFINGAILLPQKRLTFASRPMPSAGLLVLGVGMAAMMFPRRRSSADASVLDPLRWQLALTLPIVSLWSFPIYQFIWQSTRTIAAFLPILVLWLLASHRILDAGRRQVLFASSSMLAWASLVQFPFAAPIYFCYVAPLAVIVGVAAASAASWTRRPVVGPWVLLLLLFAGLSMHRGYIYNLGVYHEPQKLDVPLRLTRAHLRVSADHARIYGRVHELLERHLHGQELIAGPDSPEIHFLAGRFSPSGSMFDFFSREADMLRLRDDSRGSVLVLNHEPAFSPAPSPDLVADMRRRWPVGERVGHFEVRWR